MIPSSTLQLITDLPAVERALRAVLGHLVPGGWTFASIMTLWKSGDPLESEWDHSVVRPEDGATVRRLVRVRYDPENECEHTDDLYQVIVDGQVVEEARYVRSPATRSYAQTQVKQLFEEAGFANVKLYSEFTENPVKPDDTTFVVGAQRQS